VLLATLASFRGYRRWYRSHPDPCPRLAVPWRTRSRNNILWMDILRIALTFAPKDTKEILGKINANDKEISGYLEKLAK